MIRSKVVVACERGIGAIPFGMAPFSTDTSGSLHPSGILNPGTGVACSAVLPHHCGTRNLQVSFLLQQMQVARKVQEILILLSSWTLGIVDQGMLILLWQILAELGHCRQNLVLKEQTLARTPGNSLQGWRLIALDV